MDNERKLLEAILRPSSKTTDEANNELLKLNELLSAIKRIDLEELHEAVADARRPIDSVIENLRSEDRKVKRVIKKKKTRKTKHDPRGIRGGKMHHLTRRRNRLEYRRNHEYGKAKVNLAKLVEKGGWYDLYAARWKRRGAKRVPKGTITREEWNQYVEPHLSYKRGGTQPIVSRLDTSKGFSLENILVADRRTGEVLFDGTDFALSRLGDVLTEE